MDMLEEIISVKHLPGVKMLSAKHELIAGLPEISSKISFLPFINFLKEKLPAVSETIAGYYNYLIKKFEAEPDLLNYVEDFHLLDENADMLELLGTALFPAVGEHEKNSFALAVPYKQQVFYYSDYFRKLFLDKEETCLLLPEGIPTDRLKAIQCSMIYENILEKFYGINLNESPELVYPVTDSKTGLWRYFRIRYDARFIDVHLKGKLPPIQDCAVCLNTFRILDIETQLEKMPLDLFEAEGFAVWIGEDITTTHSLDIIKKILLREDDCDTTIISQLKKAVQALVGLNEVEVGLMPFVKINGRYVLDEECAAHSLVAKQWQTNNPEHCASFNMYMEFLCGNAEPVPISNLSEEATQFAPFMRYAFENGARSFINYPMQNSDGLIGVLELSSAVPNLLTYEVITRLEPAIPLLSVAMLKNRDTFNNRIDKIIKEKFTALQQPVEWKFAEAAWEYLRSDSSTSLTSNVGFENVYPLYGAVDIRNSSVERSLAIQKDLNAHLILVNNILDLLQSLLQLPLLEGLKFKNQTMQQSLQNGMLAEDEVRITEFLKNEIEPVFLHLQKGIKPAKEIVDRYFNMLYDRSSILYRSHSEYEETLGAINEAVLNCLEQEEESLQKSYPHYFEKYRTDGVEYNIYIGQSIAPDNPFDQLYLKNIRLWQLKSMAETARITHKLLPSLKVALQTTQLILIHSHCISINFRKDERRFDVEGSYNIRYEIMKKRLDKVCIKDTGERLTQPKKIAMVFSNQKDMPEYQQYIEFLQNKNMLKPGIEFLELEELQGLIGLKALRVEINMDE